LKKESLIYLIPCLQKYVEPVDSFKSLEPLEPKSAQTPRAWRDEAKRTTIRSVSRSRSRAAELQGEENLEENLLQMKATFLSESKMRQSPQTEFTSLKVFTISRFKENNGNKNNGMGMTQYLQLDIHQKLD
jgi:hypothetical protein